MTFISRLAKELFAQDEFSGRPFHPDAKNLGIIYNDGPVWQEQRRFSLKQLRDFGFGRRGLESVLHEEAEELIKDLVEEANSSSSVSICLLTTN